MNTRINIVVVVSDTLRAASLGCYGNTLVRTPHMDRFARRSARFLRAFPESLPTIPVRRALHTGRRAFPFRGYRPLPWDIVYLPGWQPMDPDEDTVAENLAAAGYQTGFVTDTLPYFAPGFNFTRGFWQWEYVRGQQQDRWRSPYSVPADRLSRYGDLAALRRDLHQLIPMHLANTAHVRTEEDTSTARTFSCAVDFLRENVRGQPFYLLVDCFDPHEPWEAPESYYLLYGDPAYKGRRIVHCAYAPLEKTDYTREEVAYVQAQYHGLVTLVDAWFGRLLDALEDLGLSRSTAVILTSDHGTNFCDNPRRVIGKPADSLYPGLMRLPLLVGLPDGSAAGTVRDELVSNVDLPATVYDLASVRPAQEIHGRSLLPLLGARPDAWMPRPYVTSRYGDYVCAIDDSTWAIGDVQGNPREVFDLTADPACMSPLAPSAAGDRWKTAWDRILCDAGGSMPVYAKAARTDAIGEKPVGR